MMLIVRRRIVLLALPLKVVKEKNPILQQFGRNVRALRESQAMSQEDFAALVELDRTYIGGIERGERNVGILNVCRIARALGVDPALLFVELEIAALNSALGTPKVEMEANR